MNRRWAICWRIPSAGMLPNLLDSDINDPSSRVVVAVESNGVIRDDLLRGVTGKVTVGDLFRTIPLGIGVDNTMAYPLLSFYLYGYELKKALEILTSIRPIKGDDYYLQISGLRFTYNPRRIIFDRVTDIETGSEEEGYQPLDYSKSNKKLYRVAANIYNASFLKLVGSFTYSMLEIVPKDKRQASCKIIGGACGRQQIASWHSGTQRMAGCHSIRPVFPGYERQRTSGYPRKIQRQTGAYCGKAKHQSGQSCFQGNGTDHHFSGGNWPCRIFADHDGHTDSSSKKGKKSRHLCLQKIGICLSRLNHDFVNN